MSDPAANFATPRLASGALFVDGDRVLLVRKSYGNRWDIPGGYVDRGESPTSACAREVRGELGLDRTARRLLVHDWAPNGAEGDKILYIFDCGDLGGDERNISLDGTEIDKTEWAAIGDLASPTPTAPTRPARSCTSNTANPGHDTMLIYYGVGAVGTTVNNRAGQPLLP